MKQLSEMIDECSSALQRNLTPEELDHLYIMQITGSWGFTGDSSNITNYGNDDERSLHGIRHISSLSGSRDPAVGNWRYVAKPGNPIDWQRLPEYEASKYVGILLRPEKGADRLCCAQFVGRQVYRVPLTIDQAERAVYKMAEGKSLLNAVEIALGQPLGAVERKLINEIMKN